MKKKVSIATLILSCLLVFAVTFAIPKLNKSEPIAQKPTDNVPRASSSDQIRLKTYKYVQPLILVNPTTESASLQGLRSKVDEYISQLKSSQQVEQVSVYFRRLNEGTWFCINPSQTYNPASMSKIIYLITYLKEAETNPGVMSKKIYFARHFSEGNQQNIKDFALKENVEYTVNDLMIYMIKYSDNDATMLLSQNMNVNIYKQLFADFHIPEPPVFGEYFITPVDYSKFFRVLYNSTYIRADLSEFALKLLAMSTYKDGIRQGIDQNVEIAHKFGERVLGNKTQLHEFGIVYVKGDPYLIGVMTTGSSLAQLSQIVGEISRMTYSEFNVMYHS